VRRVSDCACDGIRLAISQLAEWQHIGDWIDTAFVMAWPDFVKVYQFQFTEQQEPQE